MPPPRCSIRPCSGIGPPEHLRQLGLGVVVDLPVGAAVQDHANVSLSFDLNPALAQGVNVKAGRVTNPAVAETFGLECAVVA